MIYPLVRELAKGGIPVPVTCGVLEMARQPYCRWLAEPVTRAELDEAYLANALFDAHRDDPEFGYRFRADEIRDAGHELADRTAWRICSANGWLCVFGTSARSRTSGPVGSSATRWPAGWSLRSPSPPSTPPPPAATSQSPDACGTPTAAANFKSRKLPQALTRHRMLASMGQTGSAADKPRSGKLTPIEYETIVTTLTDQAA